MFRPIRTPGTHAFVPVRLLRSSSLALLLAVLLVLACWPPAAHAQSPYLWRSIGPYGGDARAFATVPGEPEHLYLGGTNTWIFESLDGGLNWSRLSRVDSTDDLIVDSIVVDTADRHTLFAGVWRADRPDGGLYASHDAGKSWKPIPALHGQSVLSLAQSASDPDILVAGTLLGVYRSSDHGASWALMSPEGSKEIHEVESLAIDPHNPEIVYAGTWHLPWKTTDGGQNWHNIKQGVIDDSDVFSIILDPERPSIVYASACSGIYKSENSGELFHKIQGIPSTARRTRVLMQDTKHRDVVYAGTTEGLYRTRDAGKNWSALTGSDVIINDIYLDPARPGRVLLATDRGGVLASDDQGATFQPSNQGFSARKIEALIVDPAANGEPGRILAGVVNDKQYGGVFQSRDGGASWAQLAAGLDGRDVFTLAESRDGTVLAGTNHGIFALTEDAGAAGDPHWVLRSSIVNHGTRIVSVVVKGKKVNREESFTVPAREMGSRVAGFDLTGDVWLAATDEGLLTSADQGATWQGGLVLGSAAYRSVAVFDGEMLASRREGVVFSRDDGKNWTPMRLPSRIKDIRKVAFSPDGQLWLGTGDGVYFSRDKGDSWFWLEKVPVWDVGDLFFDRRTGRMLASARSSQMLYSIDPQSLSFTATATGFRLFEIKAVDGLRLAASLQDGVLIEPETSASGKKPPPPATAPVASKSSNGPQAPVHPALPQN